MHDDHLHAKLDAWGERERLTHSKLPPEMRSRLAKIRALRRLTIGAAVGIAIGLIALLAWLAPPRGGGDAPAPTPEEVNEREPVRPTVGGLSSANGRFGRLTGEVALPSAPDLRWVNEPIERR